MSIGDDDDFWNTSSVKAFNFDDEEQQQSRDSHIKTLGSILAAKTPSNEPFLKPSVMMCHGKDKIDLLVEHLNKTNSLVYRETGSSKQDPKVYIADIVNKGLPIDFSSYKSKHDKLLLLDCAICCCDGNTITAAAVFLSKTLKKSIFVEQLKKRPIALNHYINYLEVNDRSREAQEFTLTI